MIENKYTAEEIEKLKEQLKQLELIEPGIGDTSYFCEDCGIIDSARTYTDLFVETFDIKSEKIQIESTARFCVKCKKRISDVELDDVFYVKAYNEYRRKYKMLMPSQIKQIRESYNLSAKAFSKLLNLGDGNIYRYENGSLQDKCQDALIKSVETPQGMYEYLENNVCRLSDKEVERLKANCKQKILIMCSKVYQPLKFYAIVAKNTFVNC